MIWVLFSYANNITEYRVKKKLEGFLVFKLMFHIHETKFNLKCNLLHSTIYENLLQLFRIYAFAIRPVTDKLLNIYFKK